MTLDAKTPLKIKEPPPTRENGNGSQDAARLRPFSTPRVTPLDRWLTRKMVEVVGNPPVCIRLWDGIEASPPCDHPVATLAYHDRGALLATIVDPELHWGDLYSNGRVDFEGDMASFLETVYRGIGTKGEGGWLRRLVVGLGYRRNANTPEKARDNIHHHYDLGNDFYEAWLDRAEMQYTCAYFAHDDMGLEEAQLAKLEHVCRKLELSPGMTVVEAGCGWGGLARYMAREYGVRVRAYNISTEQVAYARRRAEEEGLSHLVEYVLDDYRNIDGRYDAFVSVGMLEHVGPDGYRELGAIIRRCLKPEGRGLIHSIGRQSGKPMNAWIERRIFPGAQPPALGEMMQIFEPNELTVLDVENLRLHYSRTLRHWAERYEANAPMIRQKMDEAFYRAWYLYLHGSIAAFNTGELQLYQVVFSHRENNRVPWTRRHLYEPPAARDDGRG